jgi:hypothetical protein
MSTTAAMAISTPAIDAATAIESWFGVAGAAATSTMRAGWLVWGATCCDGGDTDCTPCRVIVVRAGAEARTLFGAALVGTA